jgi:hypothetical protein
MADVANSRKRIAVVLLLVGAGLIVERVIAFGGDSARSGDIGADEVAAPPRAPRVDAPEKAVPEKAAPDSAALRLERLDARRSTPARIDPLFAPLSWQPPRPKAPPPPPAAPPPPAPQPVAPAFPYPYLGGLSEEGVRTGFFARGERVLALRAGDTVDDAYRVEQLSETRMTLTYLPLEQTLNVALGAPR